MKSCHKSFHQLVLTLLVSACGCGSGGGQAELTWGRKGLADGEFIRPRAMAFDRVAGGDVLYVVDFSGRIQAFDRDGAFLRGWQTPTIVNGRPAGIAVGRDGDVLVADSHYNQVLVYAADGTLRQTLRGGAGVGPGAFAYVGDVLQDQEGFFYVVEFGDSDRIQKFSPAGKYVKHWGTHGSEPGQFSRPRGIALGPDQLLYVADSCNHRIQVFNRDGDLIRSWGEEGTALGQMRYPYDVAISPRGDLYVAEFGNHRVQKFTLTGEPRGVWGKPGREPGCLNSPWGLAVDSKGRVNVADTENHRIQRVAF